MTARGWPVRPLLRAFLVVAIIGSACAACSTGSDDPEAAQRAIRFSDLPAYRGVAFADALKDEQDRFAGSLVGDPVTGIAAPDFAGRYTNVRDGVRETDRAECACPVVRLWFTGGSAAFGLGQRDDHTIASALVRLAERDGIALDVTNFAVPGWTAVRELAALRERLAASSDAPDVVVVHDGYNDVAGTLIGSAVHGIRPDEPAVLDSSDIQEFTRRELSAADAGGAEKLASVAVRTYGRVVAELVAVVGDHGATPVVFFQPDALASDRQLRPVRSVYRGIGASALPDLSTMLERVSAAAPEPVVNLRHVLDDEPTSVFVDWVHTNERGAEVVADAMYRVLAPIVRDVAAGRRDPVAGATPGG